MNLKNGDTVTSPFKVVFGLSPNMGVAPSGVENRREVHRVNRLIGVLADARVGLSQTKLSTKQKGPARWWSA